MSRHLFPGHAGASTVAIGWDRPLQTFFVHVLKPHPTRRGEETTVAWHGTDVGEITSAASAIEIARPWCELPRDIAIILETDRLKTLGQSDGEAQIAMKRGLLRD